MQLAPKPPSILYITCIVACALVYHKTYSPHSGLNARAVMGVAGMHWMQNVAWKPAGTWIASVLHSRG